MNPEARAPAPKTSSELAQFNTDLAIDRTRRRRARVDVVVDDRAVAHLQVLECDQVVGNVAKCAGQAPDEPFDDDHTRQPGEDLVLDEGMKVCVVPVRALGNVERNLHAY